MPIPDGRLAALLFVAAFLVRLLAVLGSAIFGTDGGGFLLMADWMAEGRFHDALSLTYHPLYPLLIALLRPVAGSAETAGNALSVILGAAAIIPLFLTMRAIFGRPAAFIVGLLYAFGPSILDVQSDVMTEGTYHFFLFSSMWLTLRMMEEPSLERGAVLGASAAAALLTRPEGLLAVVLAVAWPLAARDRFLQRAGGVLVAAAVLLLLLSPYLLWVKSVRGRWALSARSSMISAEKAIAGETGGKGGLYRIYADSVFRMTALGILIPFHLAGLALLKNVGRRKALFYLSFMLGLMGGPLAALQTHDFMSGRYLLAGMTLMNGLAASGIAAAMAHPRARWHPAAWAGLLFVVAVLPGSRAFRHRRDEIRHAPAAAAWILSQGPPPRGVTGPIQQVAYLAGSRSLYGATPEALRQLIAGKEIDYAVYTERDVEKRPDYVAMLRTSDLLRPPVEIAGPPGTVKIYVQRVR